MNILVDHITTCRNQIPIVKDIYLEADQGEFIGLIGPNGSGKSTILKSIYRLLPYDKGTVYINECDHLLFSAKEAARRMAVVSQENSSSFDFTVEEMVLMGRAPHKKWYDLDHETDKEIMNDALMKVGLIDKKNESIALLSGGEKQRVLIARAIAQQANILLLDEPTNHLDIHHQLQVMDLAKSLNLTVIAALHDLNIAASYCDRIYVVDSGEIVRMGTPQDVLTEEMLRTVFHVQTDVMVHPKTGHLQIAFLSSCDKDSSSLKEI